MSLICSNNECQMMLRGLRSVEDLALGVPSKDGILCPCDGSFKSVNPLCGSAVVPRLHAVYFIHKNSKRPMPICKYYLEIFLLLFDRSWREAVHLERYCIFAVCLHAI